MARASDGNASPAPTDPAINERRLSRVIRFAPSFSREFVRRPITPSRMWRGQPLGPACEILVYCWPFAPRTAGRMRGKRSASAGGVLKIDSREALIRSEERRVGKEWRVRG